jgi:mannitol-1-phosphate/altronate dehydrogenase
MYATESTMAVYFDEMGAQDGLYMVIERGGRDAAARVDDPLLAAELQDPGEPDTVFSYLVAALDQRRQVGIGPFTVLSSDNIPAYGVAARTMVVSFAQLRGPGLAACIEENVTSPNCMADRITLETTPEGPDLTVLSYGVDHRSPLISEPFSQRVAMAGWFRYWQVEDYSGEPIPVEGRHEDELIPLVKHNGLNPWPLLTVGHVLNCEVGR